MTIHLPPDLESSIQAAVHSGHFASRRCRDDRSRVLAPATAQAAGPGDAASSEPAAAAPPHKPIWEVAADIRNSVPDEEWAKLPVDGAEQHDHYIYGTPKRPAS